MTLEIKPGARFRSTVCTTEVAVVKATAGQEVDLRCGGHPVVPIGTEAAGGGAVEAGFDAGTPVGKRFTDAGATVEILCTKAGGGSLSIGDELLVLKDAKPLPASD